MSGPANPSARAMQARELLGQGRIEQALQLLRVALARSPSDADLQDTMARALALSGRFDQALFYARRAAEAPGAPTERAARLALLGGVQLASGNPGEAERTLALGLALDGSQLEGIVARTEALLALNRAREAAEQGRAGLAISPAHPTLLRAVAYALLTCARPDESVALLRAAVALHPGDVLLASALATATNYCPGITPAEVLALHRRAGALTRAHAAPLLPPPPSPGRAAGAGPLRVALVSPDLRSHPVAFFVEPLLERLDRARFHVACYATAPGADAVTRRLQSKADLWRDCGLMPDRDIAARIRADRADIAVDLAGLTGGGRPGVFIHRAAPVQATYLGYPATTGLSEIDWRIVDGVTDPEPAGDAPAYCSERLARLDGCFLCYRPADDAPPPRAVAGDRRGGRVEGGEGEVRFGSFNAIQKLNSEVIGVWAGVLGRVPGSTLTLKTSQLADAALCDDIRARFAAAGLGPERLRLLGRTADLRSHLDAYNDIDIALDPFPYNGTTTTCDCLLMGVPVVTLTGGPGNHAGRVGTSLLRCVGAVELAARDREEYARLAVELAGAPDRLAGYRANLRGRLLGSPLCDGPGFAGRFGTLLEMMRDHAAGSSA